MCEVMTPLTVACFTIVVRVWGEGVGRVRKCQSACSYPFFPPFISHHPVVCALCGSVLT